MSMLQVIKPVDSSTWTAEAGWPSGAVPVWSSVLVSPFGDEDDVLPGFVVAGPVERDCKNTYLVNFGGFLGWHPAEHLRPLLNVQPVANLNYLEV